MDKEKDNKGIISFNLDLDDLLKDELELLLNFIRYLKKVKRVSRAYYRVSSSRKGYHLKIMINIPKYIIDNLNDKDEEKIKWGMRLLLGDCFGRLKVDSYRIDKGIKPDQLFLYKNGRYAGKWIVIC